MGHYDENRKFDDEWRATHGNVRETPKENKIKRVTIHVDVPTEVLKPHTFLSWTDGPKWVCDTMAAFDTYIDGAVNVFHGDINNVKRFIEERGVNTYYVIARPEEVAGIILLFPSYDIRHLVIK